MTFENPLYLLLLLLAIPYIIWYWFKHKSSTPAIRVSSTEAMFQAPKSLRQRLLHLPFILRLACYSLAVVALARPQTSNSWSSKHTEGIDIML